MPVRDHLDQHEEPGDLPLVTQRAKVTTVEAMDNNRNDEVERAAVDIARRHDQDWAWEGDDGDPHVRWNAIEDLLDSGEEPPYRDALATLRERHERPYPALLRFRVDPRTRFSFRPGQYVTVRFDETPRPYSVASPPGDGELEFCIRRVPGGRLTSKLFEDLDPGDEVVLRGPNGEFTFEHSHRDVAFLATGTGIAPLKSMLEYALATGRDEYRGQYRNLWVFLGAGWRDDLAYRERFRDLAAEHDHVHFVPTLSREELLTDWEGETAYVQQTLVKYLDDGAVSGDLPERYARFRSESPATDVEARIDPENLDVYACGVSAMVSQLAAAADALGVPEERIEAEGFG